MEWFLLYLAIGAIYGAQIIIGDWRAAHDVRLTSIQTGFYLLLWPLSMAFLLFHHAVFIYLEFRDWLFKRTEKKA